MDRQADKRTLVKILKMDGYTDMVPVTEPYKYRTGIYQDHYDSTLCWCHPGVIPGTYNEVGMQELIHHDEIRN